MKKKIVLIISVVIIIIALVFFVVPRTKEYHTNYEQNSPFLGDTSIFFNSSNVLYNNSNSGLSSNNVQDAIKDLYDGITGGCYAGYTRSDIMNGWYSCTKSSSINSSSAILDSANVKYDNNSGLDSVNVQDAIDEIISHMSYCNETYYRQNITDLSYECIKRSASIGETYYPSLKAAVEAVPTDNTETTIKVLQDLEEDNITITQNQKIKLLLQGHTVENKEIFDKESDPVQVFIMNNGTLTLDDDGEIVSNIVAIGSPGKLVINDSTVSSVDSNSIINMAGTMIMNDGNVVTTTSGTYPALVNRVNGVITINGGSVTGTSNAIINRENGIITINGGSVTGNANAIVNYGELDIYSGNITSPSETNPTVVNQNGGTLSITGGTISANSYGVYNKENSDASISGGSISSTLNYYIYNEGQIDLKTGLSLTSNINKGILYNASTGTANIKGAIFSTTNAVTIGSAGSLNVINGNISSTATSSSPITGYASSNISISGGTISGYSHGVYCYANCNLTVSGGTITSTNSYVLYNFGTMEIKTGFTAESSSGKGVVYNGNSGIATMNGGSLTGNSTYAVLTSGTFNMNAGTITNNASSMPTLFNYNGTFNMNGGTIKNNGSGSAALNSGGTATYVGGTCTPRNF